MGSTKPKFKKKPRVFTGKDAVFKIGDTVIARAKDVHYEVKAPIEPIKEYKRPHIMMGKPEVHEIESPGFEWGDTHPIGEIEVEGPLEKIEIPAKAESLAVFVDGILMRAGHDYEVISDSEIKFTRRVMPGSKISIGLRDREMVNTMDFRVKDDPLKPNDDFIDAMNRLAEE